MFIAMIVFLVEDDDAKILEGRKESAARSDYNVKVVDFAVIEVIEFIPKSGKTPDKISFTILKEYLPTGAHMTPGQGLGISSMVGVRLTN